jgi:hypothetical protein
MGVASTKEVGGSQLNVLAGSAATGGVPESATGGIPESEMEDSEGEESPPPQPGKTASTAIRDKTSIFRVLADMCDPPRIKKDRNRHATSD